MNERLLIVDDEPDICRSLVSILDDAGFSSMTANSAEDAIRLSETEPFDLVITDMRMPGMDGLTLMRRIKEVDEDKEVIILTGYASLDNAIDALKDNGAFDYLTKPLEDIDILLSTVRRALERRRLRMENKRLLKEIETRKQELEVANAELRTSRKRFKEMAEHINEAFWLFDCLEEKVLYISPAYEKLWGRPAEDLVERYEEWAESVHPDDLEFAQASFQKILETGGGEPREYRIIKPDGDIRWVSDPGYAIRDETGRVIRIVGIAEDITERKKMEQALLESEAKYRQMVELAPTAIYEMDVQSFRFLNVNEVMCDYLGYTEEELLALDPSELFTDESKKRMRERVGRILAGEQVPETVEYKIRTKNGDKIWVLVNAKILYEDGKPVKALTIAQDITGRKRLEEQLQRAQKFEAISTLAGGIAHQFNNALTGILGNIGLLEMEYTQNQALQQYLDAMKASAQRMSLYTNQLLAYARGGKYREKILSLSDFVTNALPLLQSYLDPGVRLETDVPSKAFPVKADETQLQMVLGALLENASEAMYGKGRIRLGLRKANQEELIEKNLPILSTDDFVCLAVSDEGKGMDEEARSKIFEPFFSTKFQGRGLGMAAVYGIIVNHGGSIAVESGIDQGTTVYIYLPRVEPEPEAPETTRPQIAKGSGTILLIEDEEVVIQVAQAILQKLGYRVLTAKTGQEAFDLATSFNGDIDLALLDIKLPDMSGDRIYPIIKEARPDMRVIVCSGYSLDGPARQILDAGAEDFIQKPFSLEGMSKKLKDVLQQP